MTISDIQARVDGIPYMGVPQAEEVTRIIHENDYSRILELGFAHGVSTCYMAGALDEKEGGRVTTIDRLEARNAEPNIEELLSDLGLSDYAEVHYEPTSYNWRLMKMLDADPSPTFDFCYIDGAHDWYTDGLAFFLVDKLLEPGGLILFDDLEWTFETSPALGDTERVKKMPLEEKTTPHIRKVYELLVKPHPSYERFEVRDTWAYAHKGSTPTDSQSEVKPRLSTKRTRRKSDWAPSC